MCIFLDFPQNLTRFRIREKKFSANMINPLVISFVQQMQELLVHVSRGAVA